MGKPLSLLDPNAVLNWARWRLKVESDRELALRLDVSPPVISKTRHGRVPLGPVLIVNLLEATDVRLRDLPRLVTETPKRLQSIRKQ